MRAVVARDGAWRVEDLPVPGTGAGQLLVRVRAVALNNADAAVPGDGTVVGYEFAGEVLEAREPASGFAPGDRVMGTVPGAFAEQVAVDARFVAPVPDEVPWTEAAALPTALLTEHGALMLAGFRPGATVLTTAATGGIALTGVAAVVSLGGTVIATTRSDARRDLLERSGAAHVVTIDGSDLTRAVLDVTDGRGVDIVLDHVGGAVLAAAVPATATHGTLVSIGRLGGAAALIDLAALATRQLRLIGVSYTFTEPDLIGDALDALEPDVLPLVATGSIRPVLAHVLPLEDAADALARLQDHEAVGKVVLTL